MYRRGQPSLTHNFKATFSHVLTQAGPTQIYSWQKKMNMFARCDAAPDHQALHISGVQNWKQFCFFGEVLRGAHQGSQEKQERGPEAPKGGWQEWQENLYDPAQMPLQMHLQNSAEGRPTLSQRSQRTPCLPFATLCGSHHPRQSRAMGLTSRFVHLGFSKFGRKVGIAGAKLRGHRRGSWQAWNRSKRRSRTKGRAE